MPWTRFASSRGKTAIVWPTLAVCVLSVAMVVACAPKPKSEYYRRLELFSAGHSKIEFMCRIGLRVVDTLVATTPWTVELQADTGMMGEFGGDRCLITRTDAGPDKLWVWAFDRDSLRLSKYVATQFDTVDFYLLSLVCLQGKP